MGTSIPALPRQKSSGKCRDLQGTWSRRSTKPGRQTPASSGQNDKGSLNHTFIYIRNTKNRTNSTAEMGLGGHEPGREPPRPVRTSRIIRPERQRSLNIYIYLYIRNPRIEQIEQRKWVWGATSPGANLPDPCERPHRQCFLSAPIYTHTHTHKHHTACTHSAQHMYIRCSSSRCCKDPEF